MDARTLLVRAGTVATMDDAATEFADGGVFVRGPVIEAVGPRATLPASADEVIDLPRHVLLPGLVNTHHHLFQTLTRALPAAQDASLFDWLRTLYPVWARLTPEMIHASALTGFAELLLSGCTTTSDHLYLYPNGSRLDDTLRAAAEIGIRFHACRGSMSVGESAGGLPPDALVETEAAILADSQRVIEAFHDARPRAMTRIALAPCSPFSVSRELMRDTAALARSYGVGLHTHLAESDSDVAYSHERFGCTPAEYAESLGWTGPDVWHAHCVKLDTAGIERFAATRTGVAHCPTSNMRLASASASTAARRTMPASCWPKPGRRCCCSGSASGRRRCRRARRCGWRPAVARRSSVATTSASSRPAAPPTSSPSTSPTRPTLVRPSTTRSPRWCSARRPGSRWR